MFSSQLLRSKNIGEHIFNHLNGNFYFLALEQAMRLDLPNALGGAQSFPKQTIVPFFEYFL